MGLAGIRGQHLAHRLDGGVGPVELPLRQLGGRRQRRDLLFFRRRALGALLEDAGQLVPALRAAQDALEVRRGAAVARLDLERLAQVALDLRRARPVARVALGDGQVQVGGELAVRRDRGLVEVLPDDALPVVAQEAGVREQLGGGGVVGAAIEDALETLHRAALVEQLLEEQAPLVEEQVGLALAVNRRRELDVEQPRDELELTAIAKRAPRLVERAGGVGRRQPALVAAGRGERDQRRQRLSVVGVGVESREVLLVVGHASPGGRP